ILRVADDDHPPGADVLERLLDRRESGILAHRSTSFSTYFAITSTSRLNVCPGAASVRLVRVSVSGIRETPNPRSSTEVTVRLTPLTSTEFPSVSSAAQCAAIRSRVPPSAGTAATTRPRSWTRPVNKRPLPLPQLGPDEHVLVDHLDRHRGGPLRFRDRVRALALDRHSRPAAPARPLLAEPPTLV